MTELYDLLAAYNDASIVYVADDGSDVNCLSLRRSARSLADQLQGAVPRFRAGDAVLVACTERPTLLAGCLAVWALGGVVIIPPNTTPATLAAIAADSGASALLVDEANLKRTLAADERIGALTLIAASGAHPTHGAGLQPVLVQASTLVASIYTSGTTGAHQRCDKTAGQLFGEAKLLARTFEITPAAIVAATVPAHHLYGLLFSILMPLVAGARFVARLQLPACGSPASLAISDLVTVPLHARALLEDGRVEHLHQVRAFCSGGKLDQNTADLFAAATGADIVDVLGSSESGGIGYRLAQKESLYRPFDGLEVECTVEGALLLRSPFLPDGGAGFNELADRVELDARGHFRHLGRADGIAKIGGKRVALQELEARVLALPGVSDAALYVHHTSHLRETELWLALVTTDARWSPHSVREALAAHFDRVLLPRRYRVLESLPRNSLGKLPRAALRALFEHAEPHSTSVELGAPLRVAAGQYTVQAGVPYGLPHFKGHFNSFPILPGTAQLTELVLPACQLAYPDLGDLEYVSNLKFCRPVTPGTGLVLTLTRRKPSDAAPNRSRAAVRFEILTGAESVGSHVEAGRRARVTVGELHFRSATAG